MGYINEFGERLAPMLSALAEEDRRAIIRFVKDEILKSYKNGLRDGANPPTENDKRPAHHHRPKTSSR